MTRLEASLGRVLDFAPDGRVVMFSVGLTIIACVISSLAPALRATHHLVAGRSDRATMRVRSVFLAAQVAISVLLLTAAALLDRGLVRAASRDLGFRMEGLAAVEIVRAPTPRARNQTALRTTMSAIDDRPIAIATALPLGDASFHTGVRKAGEPEDADRPSLFQPVSANYFAVLRIPLRSGRPFTDHDPNEVVVNETLARLLWPDGGAVGGYLAGAVGTPGRHVVGVAADAHLDGLGTVAPTIFQPVDAVDHLVFNTNDIAADEVRALVATVEPTATTNVRTVGDNIASSLESAALGARIAGGLGLLALLVAAVGITGVFSFAVTERTREIGIRLALGASPARVRALLMRSAGRSTLLGAVIGLALAVVGSPALRDFLYGLSPVDPGVYVAVTGVAVATGWVATIIPVRRALRVSPATALKQL